MGIDYPTVQSTAASTPTQYSPLPHPVQCITTPSTVQYHTQYSVLPHPVQSSTTPKNMRGKVTILVCILGMIVSTMGGTRYTRDTQECTEATADMEVCTKKAYDNYKKAFEKGDDKQKPDWLARKSCTYLTES